MRIKKRANDKLRNEPGYSKWTKDIKKLFNYTCDTCKSKSNYIIAHHLYNYKYYPKLRTKIENGVCLCSDCHDDFHDFYGLICTKEQYLEFKKIVTNKRHNKPILQFSASNGKLINKFSTISDASNSTGIKYTCILWCCLRLKMLRYNEIKIIAGKYVWKFNNLKKTISQRDIIELMYNGNPIMQQTVTDLKRQYIVTNKIKSFSFDFDIDELFQKIEEFGFYKKQST